MRKFGVALLGASVFDYHRALNNARFLQSARAFQKLFREEFVIGRQRPRFLDLFDKDFPAGVVITKVTNFIAGDLDTVVIYYCGHGDVSREKEYRVLLKKSQREIRSGTLLDVRGLILDIQRFSAKKRYLLFWMLVIRAMLCGKCRSSWILAVPTHFLNGR